MNIDSITTNSNGADSLTAIKSDIQALDTAIQSFNDHDYLEPQGSVSDWDTDVTNIRAAIAAGGEVKLGAGSFYLNTTETELFLITSAKHIIGAGEQQTKLILKDGMGTSIDVFRIAPSVTEAHDIEIGHFTIEAQTTGSARCRHVFNFDPAGYRVVFSRFHDIVFPAAGDIAGNDFYHYNTTDTYKFGNSSIDRNYILNGINFTQIADDMRIFENHFGGSKIGCAIYSMVTGAVNFYYYRNSAQVQNIVLYANGLGKHIFQNSVESIAGTNAVPAVVWLAGGWGAGGCDFRSSVIDNKHIYAEANSQGHCLAIANEKNIVIEGNYLTADSSATIYKDLLVDTSCLNVRVNRNNIFVNSQIGDAGGRIKVVGLAAGETDLLT